MVRKIEKVMGKFLWNSSGKVLRVAMGEMKNTVEKGGLGVTCILSMSRSLILSQQFRLLKSGDEKSLGHVGFWIEELIGDLVLGLDRGDHDVHLPEYFAILADHVLESRNSDLLSVMCCELEGSHKQDDLFESC